jgi:ABC-type multidrug transport system fused ATPase/permease subunit
MSNYLQNVLAVFKSNICDAILVLDNGQRRVFIHWLVAQSSLVILDFLSLALTAVVTSAFIPIIQSKPENIPKYFVKIYEYSLPKLSIYEFIFILIAISGALIISRALLSIVITRHYFYKVAQIQVKISEKLIVSHFNTTLDLRLPLSQPQLIQTLTSSLNSLVTYVLANLVIGISEILSIFLLVATLVIYLPTIGLAMGILGLTYMLLMTTVIIRSSTSANRMNALNELQAVDNLLDLSQAHDESRMLGSFSVLKDRYLSSRLRYSISLAERQVQFQYPKVALEIGSVVLGLILSILVWYFLGAKQGVTFLAIFAVLGIRIQPGVSKVQNCLLMIRQHIPSARSVIDMKKYYSSNTPEHKVSVFSSPGDEVAQIKLVIDSLEYGKLDDQSLVRNLNYTFMGPGLVLLKGKNGSGKSTLLQIMCGLREPLKGNLHFEISANKNNNQIVKNLIAYLPQEVSIINGDLHENLTLGSEGKVDINVAQLLLNGFKFLHGKWNLKFERNYRTELSGGEKQKIGLVRFFSQSSWIMIMDEPASALDAESIDYLKSLILDRKKESLLIITSHTNDFDALADDTFSL